jgi:branched-chain amino acid transport system permease protein
VSTFFFLTVTGLSVGALYFLLASGLGLIFGLMRVLSFAHGAFLTLCAYVGWVLMRNTDIAVGASFTRWILAVVVAVALGAAIAFVTEVLLIRPLYSRDHLDQLLVTMGLGFIIVAAIAGVWTVNEEPVPIPHWIAETTSVFGAQIPNDRFILVGAAVVVLALIQVFLKRTRHGLIVRAGVENREMVRALGIDVRRSFTLVFSLGGAAAGLGGVLAASYARAITPGIGDQYLLYAFIVLIIGGLGSITGAAIGALIVGLFQQFVDFYINPGLGDILVVVLMAVMLLVRPQGIAGRKAARLV